MAEDFKAPNISRTIPTENTQFTNVIWQAGRPPLDSELNLMGQLAVANQESAIRAQAHSGVLIDPRTSERDYIFNPLWSNLLKVKKFEALINGFRVEVSEREVKLPPPPESGDRADFVFLEAWKSLVSAEGGVANNILLSNKPDTNTIYTDGDVSGESGAQDDHLVDPSVAFETTKRVQIQFQIRVVSGVDFKSHPEGLTSTLVYAHGPTSGEGLSNFTPVEGDLGLWSAGVVHDTLTEDTVYAIPLCAVFRRNQEPYVAVSPNLNGSANQNGAVNRKPSSTTTSDAVVLTQASLNSFLPSSSTGLITLNNVTYSEINDDDFFSGGSRFLVLGSGVEAEIIKVSSLNGNQINIEERGVAGTQAKRHNANTLLRVFNNRPDGKYADEIHPDDVVDMRHATTLGEWDYQSLLESAVGDLLFNRMRSSYKQNSINSDCKGAVIEEVSFLSSDSANQTHQLDFPNGFRDTWSDASVMQSNITLYLNPNVALQANGRASELLNVNDQENWEIGPDLQPTGLFLFDDGSEKVKTGSIITLTLNTDEGNLGYGLDGGTMQEKGLRVIAPREIGTLKQDKRPPIIIEQLGVDEHEYLSYPTEETNYERPFCVFGRSRYSVQITTTVNNHKVIYQGNAESDMNVGDVSAFDQVIAMELADASLIPSDLLDRITDNGRDLSGNSSTLYVMVYGDPVNQVNNGIFKVVKVAPRNGGSGSALAGTAEVWGYYQDTQSPPTPWAPDNFSAVYPNWIILKPIDNINLDYEGAGADPRTPVVGKTLTLDFRVQDLSEEDTEIAIAITDADRVQQGRLRTSSPFQISLSVMYPPSVGGTANVADNIHKLGLTPTNKDNYLRNVKSDLDTVNATALPIPIGEIDLPTKNHLSLWNRLPSSNLPAGWNTLSLGGRIINEEADREAESFKDEGSKTLVLRPFQRKRVLLHPIHSASRLFPLSYVAGHDVDDENMWLPLKGYKLPEQMMPRFGRQDIPMHTRTGSSDSFMAGLNHIFVDKTSVTDGVFSVVGGLNTNQGTQAVFPVLMDTRTTYGFADTVFINGLKVIGARKRHSSGNVGDRTISLSVPTSDFGPTLQGIELPPYYGVARVYGVYNRADYETYVAGNGINGGHNALRDTPIGNITDETKCPNLLRSDADKFTLYLNQNGANEDVSGATGAHTYILTEHAIDITRIPSYDGSQTFSTFDYIVEMVVFGFADGFITDNRVVMMRHFSGGGLDLTNIDNRLAIDSVIPFAPSSGSDITVAYRRTAYQGDPFYTKNITFLDDTDQTVASGRKSVADLVLGVRDQDTVQLNNRRNLQVLASLDFYTTLGTGKIGGSVYPTTITDIGHSEHFAFRNPALYSTTYPKTLTSTFTSSSARGGFASLFLLNSNIYDFTITIESETQETIEYVFDRNVLFTFTARFAKMMSDLRAYGYDSVQISDDSGWYGLILREPHSNSRSVISISWIGADWDSSTYVGQTVQVFTGIRETPRSFNFDNNGITLEFLYGLRPRTDSKVHFSEVGYAPENAGNGETPISLVGVTSRLPLGSLVRDADFLCEDILNNQSSYLFSSAGNLSSLTSPVPVNENGQPYSRATGRAGDLIQMTDGSQNQNAPLTNNTSFTVTRGGGAIFGASGEVAGSPLSFLVSSFSQSLSPVLKGSALACRAMLVKNFEETFLGATRSRGDEVQLLIVTHCIDGATGAPIAGGMGTEITLGGLISPMGYGEGFASADRYRLKGRPLVKSYSSNGDLNITPAPYNSNQNG